MTMAAAPEIPCRHIMVSYRSRNWITSATYASAGLLKRAFPVKLGVTLLESEHDQNSGNSDDDGVENAPLDQALALLLW